MSGTINDLLSGWLDDETSNSTSTEDAVVEGASEAIADSLLIHGLLSDVGRRDEEAEAKRLRSVMERIDSESDSDSETDSESVAWVEPPAGRADAADSRF